ncbi:hypothetical protein SAMN05216550_10721 [Paraburkholderia tropica]|uniref:Uncharacterized protein n=1 Tax=Paraburkholderia tropica TaxID=92647 RepID=A0AAQ1GFC0_9BURK|nr:hypothetical protein SAMN05216550_10721 [Paraburkholderia tropica]
MQGTVLCTVPGDLAEIESYERIAWKARCRRTGSRKTIRPHARSMINRKRRAPGVPAQINGGSTLQFPPRYVAMPATRAHGRCVTDCNRNALTKQSVPYARGSTDSSRFVQRPPRRSAHRSALRVERRGPVDAHVRQPRPGRIRSRVHDCRYAWAHARIHGARSERELVRRAGSRRRDIGRQVDARHRQHAQTCARYVRGIGATIAFRRHLARHYP